MKLSSFLYFLFLVVLLFLIQPSTSRSYKTVCYVVHIPYICKKPWSKRQQRQLQDKSRVSISEAAKKVKNHVRVALNNLFFTKLTWKSSLRHKVKASVKSTIPAIKAKLIQFKQRTHEAFTKSVKSTLGQFLLLWWPAQESQENTFLNCFYNFWWKKYSEWSMFNSPSSATVPLSNITPRTSKYSAAGRTKDASDDNVIDDSSRFPFLQKHLSFNLAQLATDVAKQATPILSSLQDVPIRTVKSLKRLFETGMKATDWSFAQLIRILPTHSLHCIVIKVKNNLQQFKGVLMGLPNIHVSATDLKQRAYDTMTETILQIKKASQVYYKGAELDKRVSAVKAQSMSSILWLFDLLFVKIPTNLLPTSQKLLFVDLWSMKQQLKFIEILNSLQGWMASHPTQHDNTIATLRFYSSKLIHKIRHRLWIHPKIADVWSSLKRSIHMSSLQRALSVTSGCSRYCSSNLMFDAVELGRRIQLLMGYHPTMNWAQDQTRSKTKFPTQYNNHTSNNSSRKEWKKSRASVTTMMSTILGSYNRKKNTSSTVQMQLAESDFSTTLSPEQLESLLNLQIHFASLLLDWNIGPWMIGKGTLLGSIRHSEIIPWSSHLHNLVNYGQWISLVALLTKGGKEFESGGDFLSNRSKAELSSIYNSFNQSCINILLKSSQLGVTIVQNEGTYFGRFQMHIVTKKPQAKNGRPGFFVFSSLLSKLVFKVAQLTKANFVSSKSYGKSTSYWTPSITVHPLIHSSLLSSSENRIIYDISSNIQIPTTSVYPLHPRPLGPLLLPAPQSPIGVTLSTFGALAKPLSQCYRRFASSKRFSPLHEGNSLEKDNVNIKDLEVDTTATVVIADKNILNRFYSFVEARSSQSSSPSLLITDRSDSINGICDVGFRTVDEIFIADSLMLEKYPTLLEIFYPGGFIKIQESYWNHGEVENEKHRLQINNRNGVLNLVKSLKKLFSKNRSEERNPSNETLMLYGGQPWWRSETIVKNNIVTNELIVMGGTYDS